MDPSNGTPSAPDHEAAFAKAFLTSEKRARFVQQLADPKRRKELLPSLDEDLHYMPGFATAVPGAQDFPDELDKPVALYGGTFRPDNWDGNYQYLQQTGTPEKPDYYARTVAFGCRTVWPHGCSHRQSLPIEAGQRAGPRRLVVAGLCRG